MDLIDSTPVIEQTSAIQAHLRRDKLCLLGLLDLAAISVAAKCDPTQWKTLLANRKTHSDALIASIEKLTKQVPQTTRYPIEAGHILMCAPLTSTAEKSQPFLDFCKELEAEPSTATQALYFFLPFAVSHQGTFVGSRYFAQWFPFCADYAGYQKFKAQQPLAETQEYHESINSIFRKLDFSPLEKLIPESLASRYGLGVPKPVVVGDYMQLQVELIGLTKAIRQQERRTEVSKIDKYAHKVQKLESCLVKGTSMKPKYLQQKVNKAAALLSLMQLNPIDERVLRAQISERYNKAIPIFNKHKQRASYDRLQMSNNFDAYRYVPIKVGDHLTLDQLEQSVQEIERVISVLENHSVIKSN